MSGALVSGVILDDFRRIWEEGGRNMAANGAVMRTGVVGALFYKDEQLLYTTAIDVAATTHADPRCLVSCTIVSALVAGVWYRHAQEDVLKPRRLFVER